LDPTKIKLVKRPLLDYLYHTFLESEKISDEFNKYITNFCEYIRFEAERVSSSTSFTDEYYQYINSLFIMLCSYKKAFANTLNPANLKSIGTAGESGKGSEVLMMN
jgi:hypothetical protein